MTFDDIVTHAISARFKEAQRGKVQLWVRRRYAFIWSVADWPWKSVGPTTVSVTAGDSTPALPSDLGRPRRLYDSDGSPLILYQAADFDDEFLGEELDGSRGRPRAWKWEGTTITLGPVPDTAYSLRLSYDRRIAHRDINSVVTDGTLQADSDYPIWDNRDFDYVLVPGAISTGLKEENDPTWRDLEEEFQQIVNDMREFYLPSTAPYGNLQYGRDGL